MQLMEVSWYYKWNINRQNLRRNYPYFFCLDINLCLLCYIWAGRIAWLRKAWIHIPVSIKNSEDFQIGAVLNSFNDVPTNTPKCPCPEKGKVINPDFCAVSLKSSAHHVDVNLEIQVIKIQESKIN